MSSVLCHAKANDKYLNNYNENKDLSYVIYLDKNNLYGLAISLNLSVDGFERDEISKFTLKTTFKNLMKILILGVFWKIWKILKNEGRHIMNYLFYQRK